MMVPHMRCCALLKDDFDHSAQRTPTHSLSRGQRARAHWESRAKALCALCALCVRVTPRRIRGSFDPPGLTGSSPDLSTMRAAKLRGVASHIAFPMPQYGDLLNLNTG
jgi:hypothetical protein